MIWVLALPLGLCTTDVVVVYNTGFVEEYFWELPGSREGIFVAVPVMPRVAGSKSAGHWLAVTDSGLGCGCRRPFRLFVRRPLAMRICRCRRRRARGVEPGL
jgi:hypothetical protein